MVVETETLVAFELSIIKCQNWRVLEIVEFLAVTSKMKKLIGERLAQGHAIRQGQRECSAHSPCFQLILSPHAAWLWPLTKKIKS